MFKMNPDNIHANNTESQNKTKLSKTHCNVSEIASFTTITFYLFTKRKNHAMIYLNKVNFLPRKN